MSSDEDQLGKVTHIVTVKKMTRAGLKLFYTEERVARVKTEEKNSDRFRMKYGVMPVTACTLYEDMQKTNLEQVNFKAGERSLKFFLISLYFLRHYPNYNELESTFDLNQGHLASKIWIWISRFKAMKEEAVIFPDVEEIGDEIWIMTVDGTHVWIKEPSHVEFSQDRAHYSHKFNKAAKSYELGISLTGGLIWMNGPYPAGTNDITIFRKPQGLKELLQKLGKKAIGDRGYRGEPDYVSFPNALDSKAVDRFKSRALCRHETFNGMTKIFSVLSGRFRHSDDKFEDAFEAVCVICQYKLENELPLYDILIQAVLDANDDQSSDSISSD